MKFKIDPAQPFNSLRDVRVGLDRHLTFSDQFDSFVVTSNIPASSEKQIRNEIKGTPTEWMVVDAKNVPPGALIRGETAWDENYVYLKNTANTDGVFKIRFFRGEHKSSPLEKSESGSFYKPALVEMSGSSLTCPNTTTGRQNIAFSSEDIDLLNTCSLSSNKWTLSLKGWWKATLQINSLTGSNFANLYIRNVTQSSDEYEMQDVNCGSDIQNPVRVGWFEVTDEDDEWGLQWVTGDASATLSAASATLTLEKVPV